MLLLPEGQKDEAWEFSDKHALSDIVERWTAKYLHMDSQRVGKPNRVTNTRSASRAII
jgi:hypothetical protein